MKILNPLESTKSLWKLFLPPIVTPKDRLTSLPTSATPKITLCNYWIEDITGCEKVANVISARTTPMKNIELTPVELTIKI